MCHMYLIFQLYPNMWATEVFESLELRSQEHVIRIAIAVNC